MRANGSAAYPLLPQFVGAGPGALGHAMAALAVGRRPIEGGGNGFGYAGEGPLVGGDLQLLGTVALIPRGR
jgi:hypothetical protein